MLLSFDAPKNKSNKRKLSLAALILGTISVLLLRTTLAANISINSSSALEYGQGVAQTVACSGATNIVITPTDAFTNASSGGNFYFNSFTVSNIPTSCYGDDFKITAFDNSSNTALALYNSTSTEVAVGDLSGSFYGSSTESGLTISTLSSSSFSAKFVTPVALATTVFKLAVQSQTDSLTYSCFAGKSCTLSSWTHSNSSYSGTYIATSQTGQYSVTGGNSNVILVSSNYGSTWTTAVSGISNAIYRVACSSTGQYMAVEVMNGPIYISSNYGATFSTSGAGNAAWEGITVSTNGQHLVAVQNTGYIFYSSDGGSTWTQSNSINAGWFNATASYDGSHVVATEHTTNKIWYSSDFGATWTQSNAATHAWQGLAASSDGSQIIANYDLSDVIYRSTDYGATWSATNSPSKSWDFVASNAAGNLLLAGTYIFNSGIYESTDSGATWTQINSAASTYWQGLAVSGDSSHLFGVAIATNAGIYTANYS